MAEQRDSGFELVLSNRQLLSLFFVVVVFFAAFFSVGYVVGFGHGEGSRSAPVLAESPPPSPAQEEVRLPDSLLRASDEEEEPSAPPARVQEQPKEQPKESPRIAAPPVRTAPPPEPVAPPRSTPEPVRTTAPAETPARTSPPVPRPATAAASAPAAGAFHVQVSAVRVEADAVNLANGLKQKGYPAQISTFDGWYRIMVGPFASREAAEASRSRLNNDGFDTVLRAP